MDVVVAFVVGVALGGLVAVLAAPAIQAWIAHREWIQASREIDAVDRLLERLDPSAHLEQDDRMSSS